MALLVRYRPAALTWQQGYRETELPKERILSEFSCKDHLSPMKQHIRCLRYSKIDKLLHTCKWVELLIIDKVGTITRSNVLNNFRWLNAKALVVKGQDDVRMRGRGGALTLASLETTLFLAIS